MSKPFKVEVVGLKSPSIGSSAALPQPFGNVSVAEVGDKMVMHSNFLALLLVIVVLGDIQIFERRQAVLFAICLLYTSDAADD